MSGIRVAGHTYPYRDRPLGDALDELAKLRLDLVEVWLGHAADGPDGVAGALRERGFEAVAVGAGGFYTTGDDVSARAFELADALAAPLVVACVAPEVLDSVLRAVPAGVTLCLENHWDQPLATAKNVRRILSAHADIAACVDTGHAILAGEMPERFVTSLADRVGHVHLKDAVFPPLRERLAGRRLRTRLFPRPEPAFPGAGALSVGRIRRALEAVSYHGTVAVEYEGAGATAALERLLEEWVRSGNASVARR